MDKKIEQGRKYEAPAKNFPYKELRWLGFLQLGIALLIEVLAILHVSLGQDTRAIAMKSGLQGLWTPLPVIATGIIGLAITRSKYWEVKCLKVAFGLLSLFNAFVFMVILAVLTGVIDFYYYGISDIEPADADESLLFNNTPYTIVAALIFVLAIVEIAVAIYTLVVVCTKAKTYKAGDPKALDPINGCGDYPCPPGIPKPTLTKKQRKKLLKQQEIDIRQKQIQRTINHVRRMQYGIKDPVSVMPGPPQQQQQPPLFIDGRGNVKLDPREQLSIENQVAIHEAQVPPPVLYQQQNIYQDHRVVQPAPNGNVTRITMTDKPVTVAYM